MSLIEAFVRNPVKVAVAVLLVGLFGAVSVLKMPMQLTPEVQTPTLTISTFWPGASPQEVEREIILEQEEQLKGVEGVTKMSSESMDSRGQITLEFAVGANMDEALLKVNSRLQQVPEYPENAEQPVISTANASDRPIAWFILSPRLPDREKFREFAQRHPSVHREIEQILQTENPGLARFRLRRLIQQHPEAAELAPPALDISKYRRYAEDVIEARFERVPGISNVNVLGGREDELQVIVDPEKLAARQLTILDVRRVLRSQNIDVSGGDFWEGKRRWVVRTLGQFRLAEQVANQLLAVRDGKPVYIRDVADVRADYKKADGLVWRFGEQTIAINALRETGSNVLDVTEGLRQAMAELNAHELKEEGLQLAMVYDETEYIYSAIGLVKDNIFVGSALTMIVLMMFLHLHTRTLMMIPLLLAMSIGAVYLSPWLFVITALLVILAGFWFARAALVIGLAILISIVATFVVMAVLGRSLNVISLAGLAFAVGMLVDNAIVVLENIYTYYQRGYTAMQATVQGAREVWGAILASTLTNVGVFLPVIFIEEEAGQLFRDISLAISAAVALSLLVAFVVVPPAAARLFAGSRGLGREDGADSASIWNSHSGALENGALDGCAAGERGVLVSLIDRGAKWFVDATTRVNNWLQRGTTRRVVTVLTMTGVSLALGYLCWPKVEYLPGGNRNLVFGIILPPPGYNLNELTSIGERLAADLQPYWDVDPHSPEAKELKYPVIGDFFFVARGRQVFLGLRAADPTRVGELVPLVREIAGKLPGTFAVAKQSSLFEQGLSAGRTIDIEITGPDLPALVSLGRDVIGRVGGVLPNAQAIPRPSLDLSSPEVHVEPKLLQAAELGLTTSDIGYMVDALVDGAYASDYYLGGTKIDLTIHGRDNSARRTQEIEALPIATHSGQLVPLGAVASVRLGSGPEQINHRERQRAITIQVSPPPEMALEDAMLRIQEQIVAPLRAEGKIPSGFLLTLSGTTDKLRQTWEALRYNVLLAVIITYLLMAAVYESWLYPLVIMFTVPLGAVGGVLALSLLNVFILQPLDVLTMLGFVILIGTVVNNAILIVDQALLHMRDDGMRYREAVVAAVRSRIRPIFMTTITAVLGLLPLVLFPGAGSELYRGLGAVVLGGLIVATFFTLFMIPCVFTLTVQLKEWTLWQFRRLSTPRSRRDTMPAAKLSINGASSTAPVMPDPPDVAAR